MVKTARVISLVCMALSATATVMPTWAAEEPSYVLNNELPLPDSHFGQSLKPVMLILKGKVSATAPQTVTSKAGKSDQQAEPEVVVVPPATVPAPTLETAPSVPVPSVAVAPNVPAPAAIAPAVPVPAVPPPSVGARLASPVGTAFTDKVTELATLAESRNQEFQKYTAAVNKYSNWKSRLSERSRDMLNYSLLFKGVSPSSEAGDVILDEKSKLKGLAAAKYLMQKLEDEIQLKVVSNVLQLSMGIGNADAAEGQQQIAEATQELTNLVGKEETDKTVTYLRGLASSSPAPATVNKPLWSVSESRERIDQLVAAAAEHDSVVSEIRDDVHHYNQHGNGSMAAHRVVRTTLSAASMTPNFVGPAAQVVLFSYLTLSGGTEQEKILRELYIDKRLASRANLLGEEAHMALYNYQLSALTQNALLMRCSLELLQKLAGEEKAAKLVAATPSAAAP